MATIQAHEAAISTVTVEIKTLMVSNRQMTQSIFRQLDEGWPWDDPLFGIEGAELWGRVNYHFGPCCHGFELHINAVFSAESRLYRCTVYADQNPREWAEAHSLPQLFIAG